MSKMALETVKDLRDLFKVVFFIELTTSWSKDVPYTTMLERYLKVVDVDEVFPSTIEVSPYGQLDSSFIINCHCLNLVHLNSPTVIGIFPEYLTSDSKKKFKDIKELCIKNRTLATVTERLHGDKYENR